MWEAGACLAPRGIRSGAARAASQHPGPHAVHFCHSESTENCPHCPLYRNLGVRRCSNAPALPKETVIGHQFINLMERFMVIAPSLG